jgi:predicted DNA-binding transcriptional regulator YafY
MLRLRPFSGKSQDMPRNAEVVRQWQILRETEAARSAGVTIHQLAERCKVTTRTIRRDLEALQEAGFPLYDEKGDGPTRWKIEGHAFKGLETGFTLAELSALYFSRTLLECLAGTPFTDDLKNAFDKLEAVLTPRMRRFLDLLPRVLATKSDPIKARDDPRLKDMIARLLEATLQQRRVRLTYHSFSSSRTKDYLVEPYRVIYGSGALYLVAYVPEYTQQRTFAVQRIRRLSLLDDRFEAPAEPTNDAFAHSLGIHQGKPEKVEIEFDARAAAYVEERLWHPTQKVRRRSDGSLVMELEVCNDWALRSFVLGFGPLARAIAPPSLVDELRSELEAARKQYAQLS